mgnify:FL=1
MKLSILLLTGLFIVPLMFGVKETVAQTPEEIYSLALDAYKAGDFKKASMYLEEYVKAKPDPRAYYLLGYAYYKLKDFDKAEQAFNEAYLIDPELVPPKIDRTKEVSGQDDQK